MQLNNFTGQLNERDFDGPNSISPLPGGNALSAFIASSGETDVVRVDGQFYMSDWDSSDGYLQMSPQGRFFHAFTFPGKAEADTWRAEENQRGNFDGLGDLLVNGEVSLPTANTPRLLA